MDMADVLIKDGYRDVGYQFVNIDVRQGAKSYKKF